MEKAILELKNLEGEMKSFQKELGILKTKMNKKNKEIQKIEDFIKKTNLKNLYNLIEEILAVKFEGFERKVHFDEGGRYCNYFKIELNNKNEIIDFYLETSKEAKLSKEPIKELVVKSLINQLNDKIANKNYTSHYIYHKNTPELRKLINDYDLMMDISDMNLLVSRTDGLDSNVLFLSSENILEIEMLENNKVIIHASDEEMNKCDIKVDLTTKVIEF